MSGLAALSALLVLALAPSVAAAAEPTSGYTTPSTTTTSTEPTSSYTTPSTTTTAKSETKPSTTPTPTTTPSTGTLPSKESEEPKKTTPASEPAASNTSTTPKSGTLPFTGFDLRWDIGFGLLLIVAGFSIVAVQRRQRRDGGH